jgi:hypothetical protein
MNYLIIDAVEIAIVDFDEVRESSEETLRFSVDGNKTIIKWQGNTPSCVANLTNTEGPYSHEQILAILSTEEWTPPFNNNLNN